MSNTREIVRALVSAFNVHNYARNTIKTNFTLQSKGKKDYIVVSFDKGMSEYQCNKYLDSIKRKIIREFYGIEESNDAEVLDTAKLIFDVNSFPFDISKGGWSGDKQHGFKFVTPIHKGVIFNLKSHLVSSLKKDVLEDMPTCGIFTNAFDKKKYLWHGEFDNKELCEKFRRDFLSRMKSRYVHKNIPKDVLKVEGNNVYIKDVFNDAYFIDSVTQYIAWLKGMGLQKDNKNYSKVKAFKDLIIEFINQSTGLTVAGFVRNFPLGKEKTKILIPIVLDNGKPRVLASEEALKLNDAFNHAVFNNLYSEVQAGLSINGDSGIYGIGFSDKQSSCCVITKIIESSVINEGHELSIDPELHFRALSPPRTPPNQRDRDSGIGESPPKPKDSVAHSSSGDSGPSTKLSDMEWKSSTRSQNVALEGSPRQGLVSVLPLNPLDVPGTSREFPPRSHLSYTAVSQGVSGTSKGGNLGAAAVSGSILGPPLWSQSEPSSWKGATKNVQASTSARAQQPNLWSLPASSAGFPSSKGANKSGSAWTSQPMNLWSSPAPSGDIPEFLPPMQLSCSVANPHSSKCANAAKSVQASTSALAQQPNLWSLSASSAGFPSSSSSGTSENERSTSTRSADSGHPESPGSLQFTSEGNIQPMDCLPSQGTLGEEELTINKGMQRKGAKAGANNRRTEPTHETLSKEKEELVKALLYRFNSSNYYRGDVHTNFILENGKIVSKLNEIDKQKYLKKVRNYIINDCVTEEVAKGVYDFGQFPFVFSPDFQRDEEGKTIVAHNIDDAIPNLKVHLIQKFRIQVEEEAAKKLEKMGVTEACERIKESVYLAAKSRDSGVWYIFFDQKRFQRPDFEKFKSIYVEAFKSRWKKCGLDDSLVDYKNDALYIKDAIDINFVKKIEEYEKKEYEKLQASFDYSHEEISHIRFPPEGIEGESPIALDGEGRYFLDHDFGSDCESMDCENTERNPLNLESPLSSESSNSSSEGAGNPPSNLSESELCMGLHGANLGRK